MQTVFETDTHRACELGPAELPLLQALFEANPAYFQLVSGQPPRPHEARDEYEEAPPSHIPHGRRWFLGLFDPHGALHGSCIVVSDLGAPGVWHIALYLWGQQWHGTGAPLAAHAALQAWAAAAGAQWLRLGVVVGNLRAERFWQKLGYLEARRRTNVPAGERYNEVKVLIKPLRGQPLAEYLARVPRDRPGSTLP